MLHRVISIGYKSPSMKKLSLIVTALLFGLQAGAVDVVFSTSRASGGGSRGSLSDPGDHFFEYSMRTSDAELALTFEKVLLRAGQYYVQGTNPKESMRRLGQDSHFTRRYLPQNLSLYDKFNGKTFRLMPMLENLKKSGASRTMAFYDLNDAADLKFKTEEFSNPECYLGHDWVGGDVRSGQVETYKIVRIFRQGQNQVALQTLIQSKDIRTLSPQLLMLTKKEACKAHEKSPCRITRGLDIFVGKNLVYQRNVQDRAHRLYLDGARAVVRDLDLAGFCSEITEE
jgi:hypothetical protein